VVVLDASALLALLLQEKGADLVLAAMPDSRISSVNFCETMTRAIDRGFPGSVVQTQIDRSEVTIHPFDARQATIAADLRPATRHLGLSLGDRACLALARSLGAPVMTADRAWASLDVGIDITVIR
jgi:PIN domain nuclease of toxin-antitoxin system